MTRVESAVLSAKKYYDYLEKNAKGVAKFLVLSSEAQGKDETHFELRLDGVLPTLDAVQVWVDGKAIDNKIIAPVSFNKRKRVLTVRVQSELCGRFANVQASRIVVISDLKFLVERVQNWYKQYGGRIKFPKKIVPVEVCNSTTLHCVPSEDQLTAIEGAINNPFTYVWGAPGTGKTQLVLSRIILSYVTKGKKVLVSAPTNNAVEQTLNGLLPVMAEAGIDYDDVVIRLGAASSDFAEKYPGVCEDTALSKELSALHDQILSVEGTIKDYQAECMKFERYENLKEQYKTVSAVIKKIDTISPAMEEVCSKRENIKNDLVKAKAQKTLTQRGKESCDKKLASERSMLRYRQEKVDKYNNSIFGRLGLFDGGEKYTLLQMAYSSVQETESRIESLTKELNSLDTKIKKNEIALSIENHSFDSLRGQIVAALVPVPTAWQNCNKLNADNYQAIIAHIRLALEDNTREIEERLETEKPSERVSYENCRNFLLTAEEELQDLRSKQAELEGQSAGKRMERCLVVAATIDTCIGRLTPEDCSFSHVFMDEAGYSSLIKGCTLLAYDCPVTLLGDHMQLKPVCEMDDNQFGRNGNDVVVLWAQSVLYAEDALLGDMVSIYHDYIEKVPPRFCKLKKFDLLHTFRFGESLAEVLASEVYAEGFHGNRNHDTEIYYVDAKKTAGTSRRTNLGEKDAIIRYLSAFGDEDIGVITPYVNQKKLLRGIVRGIYGDADSIVTVHGSQGREWDTVLFSVVDTTDKYFTDSKNAASGGLHVINTAVSRAKKKLVLVCDYSYWITQKNQLICKLLNVAEELEI